MARSKQFDSWLRSGTDDYCTSVSNNHQELVPISTRQQGGIALFAGKEIRQYISHTERDVRDLGRWNSWVIQSDPSHRTRLVVAYQVGQARQKGIQTIYQQHARYMTRHNLPGSPRSLFQEDIVAAITKWIANGDRIILFIDMNEHVLTGVLPRKLLSLGLQEATHAHWGETEPHTYVYGDSRPIDGVYHTSDLTITLLAQLSFHEGVGDHRTVLVDISTSSAIGKFERRVIPPKARRLVAKNDASVKAYLRFVTKECQKHKIQRRLDTIAQDIQHKPASPTHLVQLENIDVQRSDIQRGGERRCRKIVKPHLPFSPPIRGIHMRRRAYGNLVAWHEKGIDSGGNVFRAAWRAGIDHPRKLTLAECRAGKQACKQLLKEKEEQSGQLRREHLRNRYELASDLNDPVKCARIMNIITREEQRDQWRRIKQATGEPRTGATNLVQRMEGDQVVDILEAAAMNTEIQQVTEKRFDLAKSAPVTSSSLRHLVGYNADTAFALDLLQRKVPIPSDVDDITAESINEMCRLWTRLHPNHRPIDITPAIYKYYWGGVNEATSSALSGIHFGHWKILRLSSVLIQMICTQLNLITRCGAPPSRWKNGLQVLLEKVPGVALVDKLRAILLMEGDFNFYNKWIFGHVAVNKLYEIGYVPEDQYSKRGSTAEDSKLDNRLTMDLSRQLRQPLVAVSADADKCYDRINHIIMSLLLLAIGGDAGSIKAMLSCIQRMRFFQRTGRGDSNTFMGDRPSTDPLQGLCQGNGAAPACWLMLSSLMMSVYRQGGHVSTLASPIGGTPIEFMGEIFVDDTDLLTMLQDVFSVSEILPIAQANLDKWASLLIATGGALNPSKCYWYMISYRCHNGEWEYENDMSHNLTILMPGGDRTKITQLPVTEGKKMLGVWSSPTGSDKKHLQEVILGKTSKWVGRLKNAQLPVHLAWKAYRYQLWPSIRYGLGTLATPRTDIEGLLHKLKFAMLSHLGVNQHVKTEWRRLPREFGGIGLYNLAVEQFIAWMEILLQHYGAGFTTSKKLRASLEALQLEIGCAGNPLSEEYAVLGLLATEGWVKAVWERASYYGYKVALDYPTERAPRTNDRSLMSIFLDRGKYGKELISLNRCRITHQAKYLSCISTADGKSLEDTYLSPPRTTERLSFHRFAREEPTKQDWTIWEKFWREYSNRFLELPVLLGDWISSSHRIWPWFHDAERDVLYRQNSTKLTVYIPLVKRTTRAGSLYIYLSEVNIIPTTVVPISICNISEDVVSVKMGKGPPLPPLRSPRQTFWESLMGGGGEWMWDYVSD